MAEVSKRLAAWSGLSRFGWSASLALLLAGMSLSFVLFGLFYPHWLFADQDFILVVIALETAFVLRRLKLQYLIFTEPFLIVPAVLVLARFRAQLDQLRLWKWLAGGLVVLVLWGNLLPARIMALGQHPPNFDGTGNDICVWAPSYLPRIDRLPLCAP